MAGRMTVCNMSIEAGAKAGLSRPTTRPSRISRAGSTRRRGGLGPGARVLALAADRSRRDYDARVPGRGEIAPMSPGAPTLGRSRHINDVVPEPGRCRGPAARRSGRRVLDYMALTPGTPMREIPVDTVFIGCCTNGRIEDMRAAATVIEGRRIRSGMRAMVVPGSRSVKAQAEAEGLDRDL